MPTEALSLAMAGNGRVTDLEASSDQCAANGGRFDFRVCHGLVQAVDIFGWQVSQDQFDRAERPFPDPVLGLNLVK